VVGVEKVKKVVKNGEIHIVVHPLLFCTRSNFFFFGGDTTLESNISNSISHAFVFFVAPS